MRNAGLEKAQAGIKTAGRNISNLRYADDPTIMAEREEELKSLLMKVKEESEKVDLKLSILKTKIMASCLITSWQIDGETVETVADFIFWATKSLHMVIAAMKLFLFNTLLRVDVFITYFLIFLFLFLFHFFFFSWRLITLQYCSDFCHTLRRISHGFICAPHPEPPPTSLPIPSLWVFPVHQHRALVSWSQPPGLTICFILDNIHISMLFSQIIPPSLSPIESKSLFYTSVSLFLSCI